MNKVKFLHCGDLHLGCRPNHLEERYNDFFDSFKELIDNAITKECKYILISGDLFHLKVINSKTLLDVTNLLDYAIKNGIKIITIEGNHDKAFYVDEESWLNFLSEKKYITLLKHNIVDGKLVIDHNSIYEDDNIRIIGIGYLGSMTNNYLTNLEKLISKSDKYTVLMLHAAINRLCGEEMGDISLETLLPLKSKINYIALGHIHTRYEYDDFCFNPGSIENIRIRDGKHNDKKGYYICDTDNNKEFYISKQRKIYNIKYRLENNQDIETITQLLENISLDIEENSILELTIYGNISFNPYLINFENIKKSIKEKYNLLYIEINNFINIINNENDMDNIIDIKLIENEAIANYLKINHPEIKNKDNIIEELQQLKQLILNEQDIEAIITNMANQEDTK